MYLRHYCLAAVCLLLPSIFCLAQNSVKFSTVTSATTQVPAAIAAIDVNNDGIPDLIQNTIVSPIAFTVSLAKGNGSFDAPVTYKLPAGLAAPPAMGFADFNGDGKVDIVVPLTQTDQIAVYFGNGDGTFQAPKISSVALPSGDFFTTVPLVTADFNHDGKIDVVANMANKTDRSEIVLEGNGNGTFTYKGDIFNAPSGTEVQVNYVVGGDFNADNNADVALTTNELCQEETEECNTVVHVLYGDGAFGFTETAPYSTSGSVTLSGGDLVSDGHTDLFGIDSASGQLFVLRGQTDKTFETHFSSIPAGCCGSNLAMADFNGDGRMDLAGFGLTASNIPQLVFLLAGDTPAEFTPQAFTLSPNAFQAGTNVVVGNFNGVKPGAAIVLLNGPSDNSTIATAVNDTATGEWGGCAYPNAGEGIHICTPAASTATSPVSFSATANSFGDIRKFELYIDGKKMDEQHHSWRHRAYFDLSTTLSAGLHHASLDFTNIDNDAMTSDLTFTVTAPVTPKAAH